MPPFALKELYFPLLVTGIHCTKLWVWKHICQYQWSWDKPYSLGCNHLCPYQTLSWNDTIFVVDWDILYKLCGSANKWSKGFVFSGKIWWQFFSCNKACSKYRTRSTTTPKYTLTQHLVHPHFNYCNTVWAGNCGIILRNELQKLQIRAARFLTFSD